MADGTLRAALRLAPEIHHDPAPQAPAWAATQAAEVRRALYRLGYKTPYGRDPGDWLAEDPPAWAWPGRLRPGDVLVRVYGQHVEVVR